MERPREIEVAEEHEVVERVAAIDVAMASGMVCTRVSHRSVAGKRVTKVWEVRATTGALTELVEHLVKERVERSSWSRRRITGVCSSVTSHEKVFSALSRHSSASGPTDAGGQPALRPDVRSWWTRWWEIPSMAAASRMLMPRLVSATAALRVCSMARRSAVRARSRAFRACSTALPVVVGSTGWAVSLIDASSVWNHRAAASRIRMSAWSMVLPQVWTRGSSASSTDQRPSLSWSRRAV